MTLFGLCILTMIFLQQSSAAVRHCPSQEMILPCRCLIRGEEYQIWCSHSDLPRVLEGLRSISQLIKEPIDELIIENNILPSLPGRTFYPLKVLRLMLRYNSLERVSGDWLVGLGGTLMEIFIVEPHLRSLPDDSIIKLDALQAVTIQSKLLKRLSSFSGLPNLRYIQIESESLLELSSTNFKNNPKLTKLHINNSPRLSRLEANLFTDLPQLDLINITNCALNWLHPRALSRLPLVRELSLVGNKFVDITIIGRGIRELPQLEIIRLDDNYIDKIGEAAFVELPSLKKIYLSNNRIIELRHGAFHRVPSLRTLDLNRNRIRRIHPGSFLQSSDSGLEELLLVENDISYIADLRSLLDSLPRLVFLDMRYNNLESIPYGALRGHPTIEHINLGYNKLRLIDKEAFMAMPALRELRLKNNSLSEVLQPPFWNLPALKGLDLSGNYFRRLESNFLDNLPSLRRLDLSQNELSYIDTVSFLSTKSLEHINISHNNLKIIHPATFRHLLHLYELDASYNKLLEFIPGLPRGLEYLHLKHNHLTDLPLQPSPDLDLPSLRLLDVSGNRIQNIAQRSLNTLPQLRKIYLGQNLLQTLDESALDGLNQIDILDLRDNRLVDIHPKSLKDMPNLSTINLRNNRLDLLPPDIFKYASKLKVLDMSGNQLAELLPGTFEKNSAVEEIDASNNVLVKFPQTFYGLQNLKRLDLNNNRIKTIDPEVLSSMSKIKELKLSKNFIQELKEGVFNNLWHLNTLNIDNNEIEFIQPNAVRHLPLLKSIKLDRNKIKEIPNLAFNNLPSLQILSLQENQIRKIARKAFNIVPRLIFLNLSHNLIYDMEEAGLRSLKSVELLDLSSNKITRLSGGNFDSMEWLVELRIDHNNICLVKGSVFNNMPRLRVLSMKRNNMVTFPEDAVQTLRSNIAVLDIDGNPLTCSCNMLWLQAWLQEASQRGPRCTDGTLLREMRLSRQDCIEEQKNLEINAPSCEAELLTRDGNLGTSQALANWARAKNVSKNGFKNKNELPPSPQESEYFYDDYVDYPINESLIEQNMRDKETVTEGLYTISSTSKSPQYITGDTPTIYAATKNKNTTIPPKVSNSPSTSGFTFFGIPLNNLIGGIGRKQDADPAIYSAQRKTAIVGRDNERVGMGNAQSNFPYMANAPQQILNIRPPMIPELHGGFLPIMPANGGFKPIPDPNLTTPKPSSTTVGTKKIMSQIVSTTITPIVSTNAPIVPLRAKNDTYKPQFIRDTEKLSTTVSPTAIPQENITIMPSSSIETMNKTNLKLLTEKGQHSTSRLIVTSEKRHSNYSSIIVEVTTIISNPDDRTDVLNVSTTEPVTDSNNIKITSELPVIATEEVAKATLLRPVSQSFAGHNESEIDKKIEGTSSMKQPMGPKPALLIPGGQQPLYKSGGRSTITKVPSPHIAESAPLQSSSNYHESTSAPLQSAKDLGVIPAPLKHREGKTTHESISSYVDTKNDNDWYFANYNNTHLELFVAKIINSNGGKKLVEDFFAIFVTSCLVLAYSLRI